MDDHPGGFVDDDQEVVFVDDVEGDLFGDDLQFARRVGQHDRDPVEGLDFVARLGGLSVDEDVAGVGSGLYSFREVFSSRVARNLSSRSRPCPLSATTLKCSKSSSSRSSPISSVSGAAGRPASKRGSGLLIGELFVFSVIGVFFFVNGIPPGGGVRIFGRRGDWAPVGRRGRLRCRRLRRRSRI